MSRVSTNSPIYRKADILFDECWPIILGFVRAEKFALSQDIKNAFYSLMQAIVLADKIQHKRRLYQEEIDGYLSLIIVLFNIAKTRGYITQKVNIRIQSKVDEMGRMLGGWIKTN